MKKGFFGGSFDPPHLGHLNLAIHLKEICGLEEVLFCPAAVSPFKKAHVDVEHRREMTQRMIHAVPFFQLCTLELYRETPSFTIETIEELYADAKKQGEDFELHLILGEDSLYHLEQWKNIHELL